MRTAVKPARMPEEHSGEISADAGGAGWEVVRYRVGAQGYTNVERYDANRYKGSTNEYRQAVMANAYKRLIGPLNGKRVLDVGCGTGRGIAEFVHEAAFAAGTDASVDMLGVAARKTAGNLRGAFAGAYAQNLPFRDASFDVVTSLNFLHLFSLDSQRTMIGEMKRVLKPGGFGVLEFDNALHGLVVGPYKRISGRERGSLPAEIRYVIGDGCRVARFYGAVCPVFWRVFRRFPAFFSRIEKVEYFPPFNRLAHRIYCKIIKNR